MKKTILVMATAISLFACTNPQATTNSNSDDAGIVEFKENAKVIDAAFKAFAKNDLTEFATYIADTIQFHGPSINDTVAIGKEAMLERLANFHKINKNFNPVVEVMLPGLDTASMKADGSVRSYVRWQSESIGNGVKFNQKFYGVYKFNKDHKIIDADEYFDVTGLINAATAPKQ
jgi:hypothetical protein